MTGIWRRRSQIEIDLAPIWTEDEVSKIMVVLMTSYRKLQKGHRREVRSLKLMGKS